MNILENDHSSKDDPNIAALYCNIGDIYKSQEKHKKSILAYRKALIFHEKVDPKRNPKVASMLLRIGIVQRSMGEFDSALKSVNAALTIKSKESFAKSIMIHHQRALTLTAKKNLDRAFMEHRLALERLTIDFIYT